MSRSLITRILHALLATAVIHQLVVSLFLDGAGSGRVAQGTAFELHETAGLVSLGILVLFWFWTLVRQKEHSLADLFPWFSQARRHAVFDDALNHFKSVVAFRIPLPADKTPLASAIHGLGLCVATVMAISGAVIYAFLGADGSLAPLGQDALAIHGAFGSLMWIYLITHAGIAIVHEVAGHKVIRHMLVGRN